MRHVPVLWLVEHVAREMDAACAATALLRSRHGIEAEIRHIYRDADLLLRDVVPDVVVHPFFYFAEGALATEDYVACWPGATHFNLAWEQLHYPAHRNVKAPGDAFTREQVLHHAWGGFYRRYLLDHGVPDRRIFVNGNPAYGLYSEPYRRGYQTRRELAERYRLNLDSRWVFVPENYRWAFVSDKRIRTFERWGGNRDDATELREFSRRSLRIVLRWCADVAADPDLELVFRTRPSTGESQMADVVRDELGDDTAGIHFIKRESVREWVLASDVVISSYSTTLIEAALAGKPEYMMEPVPIPQSLTCDWYAMVPSLTSQSEFRTACRTPAAASGPLAAWAREEMLGHGDPIAGLADHVAALARQHPPIQPSDFATAASVQARLPRRVYFNPLTHDHDVFDPASVDARIAAFARVIEDARRPGETS